MTPYIALGALLIVAVFVGWVWTHHRLPFRKTLKQIRRLPEHVRK